MAGVERHLLNLLPALRQRGVQADLILLADPEQAVGHTVMAFQKAGVPVSQMPLPRAFTPELLPRLVRHFRATQPDLVHTHLLHADFYGVLAARRAGVRHVVSSRHNDYALRNRWTVRLLNRWLWGRIDHGIAVSEHMRQFSITQEGARPERVTTVRYGVAPNGLRVGQGARDVLCAELGIPNGAQLVGMLCHLENGGVRHGLEAFWHVSARHPHAHLLVTGDGPERDTLQQQARGYRLSDRVHLLGWREDAHPIIAALDVLLVPSLAEGFGLLLLEGMALGTPIIASEASAIPEIVVHGETGLLVTPYDVGHLASSLLLLLDDDQLRARLAEAGKARLQTAFGAERMAEETLAVYRRVTG